MSANPITSPVTTQTFAIDADHSEVGFSVRHMLSRTRGRFAKFGGTIHLDREKPELSSVTFEVDAASIDTRNNDRDAHLRSGDFFEVEKHPVVRFTSTRVSKLDEQHYQVEGTFELRGVLKPMALEVSYLGVATDPWGNERAGFAAKASLDRRDYGLVWNAALEAGGVLVGEKVEISIELEAVKKVAAVAA